MAARKKQAGARYPHATTAARTHQCTFCAVIGAIAGAAVSGTEPWGTPHQMPAVDDTELRAEQVRDQLFNGRNCRRLARTHGPLSVSVTFLTDDGRLVNSPAIRRPEGYVLVVRVWSREQARAEIASRAERGERLHYNVLRMET